MKYVIALILFLAPFAAYAGGSSHHNTTGNASAAAAAAATGGAGGAASAVAGSGDTIALPGSSVGIGGAWQCGNQTGIGILGLSVAWTSDHELCRLGYQMARVCRMRGKEARCRDLQDRFAAWEPAKSPEVSTAAE